MRKRLNVTAEILDGSPPRRVRVSGRVAWTLMQLVAAGPTGVTPVERPAPPWSHYVLCLKRLGFDVETVHERHTGSFPGSHGRYLLHSEVRILEQPEQSGEAV